MVKVKICGVTRVQDAVQCVDVGADAIGINFYKNSSRYCDERDARMIVDAVGKKVATVGVFVDAGENEIRALRDSIGFSHVQLHGKESPDLLQRLLPYAFKALRVRGSNAIDEVTRYGGDCILLDAYVPGEAGGTGECFDWTIARRIAQTRSVVLAGGLNHHNVANAIVQVAPSWVDVASGVERSPGIKDPESVRAFIQAAKNS